MINRPDNVLLSIHAIYHKVNKIINICKNSMFFVPKLVSSFNTIQFFIQYLLNEFYLLTTLLRCFTGAMFMFNSHIVEYR